MRRIEPSDFLRASGADKAQVTAWMDMHGFSVRPVAAGGDFVEAIDVSIPADRVWPEGTPLQDGLEDCWVVVHHKMRPDGGRPVRNYVGGFDRAGLVTASTTVPMRCRPPGFIRALHDSAEQAQAPIGWQDAADELLALHRRLVCPQPVDNAGD